LFGSSGELANEQIDRAKIIATPQSVWRKRIEHETKTLMRLFCQFPLTHQALQYGDFDVLASNNDYSLNRIEEKPHSAEGVLHQTTDLQVLLTNSIFCSVQRNQCTVMLHNCDYVQSFRTQDPRVLQLSMTLLASMNAVGGGQ
jgi:hypothetical protein